MKKDLQEADKVFKYKGKAKWSETGFKEEYKQKQTESQQIQMKTIKFDFNEEGFNQEKKQAEQMAEKKEEKKTKRKKVSKKKGIKSKIAADLFGGITLQVQNKTESDFFQQKDPPKAQPEPLNFLDLDAPTSSFSPLHISLQEYEKKWGTLEGQEKEFTIIYNRDELLQDWVQGLGLKVVE